MTCADGIFGRHNVAIVLNVRRANMSNDGADHPDPTSSTEPETPRPGRSLPRARRGRRPRV
jgi:hypothetical protein